MPPAAKPRRARHRFRVFRLALLFFVLALVSLCEPRIYHFVVRYLLVADAWCNGARVRIGQVEGTVFEPLTLVKSAWHYRGATGVVMDVEVDRLTATFAWENLFKRTSNRWFQHLAVDGVVARIALPTEKPAAARGARRRAVDFIRTRLAHTGSLASPALIEAHGVDLQFLCQKNSVRLQNTDFQLSEMEAGSLEIGRLIINQPWLQKTLTKVHGATALRDSKVLLENLVLEPGVELKSLSADWAKLTKGSLELGASLDAFGGNIRAQGGIKPNNHDLNFEASGTFSAIEVRQLAGFLALSEATGGTIKNGTFSFIGSPQNLARSTTRVRFEATNFQWESRQWDSLVLGLALRDRHLQVHECVLHQGHNELKLKGELSLPGSGRAWWQSDFNWNILAKIENLTELSALMLPEFTYAAGKVNIDGEIRGHAEKFDGKLDVNGSGLQWRNAPLDELHATLRLHENELQVSNLTIFNDVDSVRGHGVVNILGPTQYWGTLRASVVDLAKYAAILQKPLVPEPLDGGAVIDWSGEGSAKGHSGKFTARLNKLRSLGASAALRHPLNAEVDGNYAAGSIVFSRFLLADEHSSFTANIAVGDKALSLQGIQLRQNKKLTLEGDALLPLNLGKAWPNTSLATLLDDSVQSRVNLRAHDLDLGPASKLTGWIFPVEGLLNGTLTADGAAPALKTGGQLTLAKAQLPLGPNGTMVSNLQGEATFEGAAISKIILSGHHSTGDFQAQGSLDLSNLHDPHLHLAVQSALSHFGLFQGPPRSGEAALFPGPQLSASFELTIEGPLSSPLVSGNAATLSLATSFIPNPWADHSVAGHLEAAPCLDIAGLWTSPEGGLELPPIFGWMNAPWSAWRFDIRCRNAAPASSGIAALDLRLTGKGSAPELNGSVNLKNLPLCSGHVLLTDTTIQLVWQNGEVFADARALGRLYDAEYSIEVLGPLRKPIRFFTFEPPLTESVIRSSLEGDSQSDTLSSSERMNLFGAPSALRSSVEVFDWSTIATPPAVTPEATILFPIGANPPEAVTP